MPLPLLLMAAVGVVADPCTAEPPLSPELSAWRSSVYAKGNKTMIPPPAAAATAYGTAYKEARKQDWADLCHYHADNLRVQALPPAARQVVFMGDSITEAWAFGDPALFQPGWIDRGVSGQTTPQMLVRFPQDVIALHPRVVHIMAGTNDVAGNTGPNTLDAIEGNIAAMVTLAKAAGIRVVLAATPPSAGFKWAPELKPAPTIAALNARLKALAAREGIVFVDYGAVLATPDGALKPDFSLDGTHPNAEGYVAIAPLTRAAVEKAER